MSATLLLWLAACTVDPVDPGDGAVTDSGADGGQTPVWTEPLDGPRLARRLSLDLRGVLPTADELARVEADAAEIDSLRDEYLQDPRLERQLVSFLAERFLTRLDEYQVDHYDYHLPDELECHYERSIGEEPLRLMARVVVEDRPWTDIVTQGHTVANQTLADVWPLELQADPDDGLDGWVDAVWTDGRPDAGVLASNGLWWRYVTSKANGNRSRAAAIANLMLCDDVLARPVSFADTPALTDEAATQEALRTNDYCLGCHAHIDPLASAMFGFYPSIDYNPDELGIYHPERESLGPVVLDVQPAWFGTPIEGMVDLGYAVATDPRFVRCGTETMAALLWRRPVDVDDFTTVESLRQQFLAGDLQGRVLLAAITDTDTYRAGAVVDGAPEDVAERENTRRMLTPDQLTTAVEDLTGFRWVQDGCDQLANDDLGFRTLAGGVDGDMVVTPQQDPGLTWALTVKRLAQAAALHVVEHDLQSDDGAPFLLDGVTLSDRPGDAAFGAQLEGMVWRMHATHPDADRLAGLEALWQAVYEADGSDDTAAAAAWVAVVSALLRDPDFLTA
ncbi:MAG: DUF1588 domain-containing protein [Alphaproteobacteria bacterium]|nr:DUF1588 domain-containing protein [Alphaproteobacteria bacterium]